MYIYVNTFPLLKPGFMALTIGDDSVDDMLIIESDIMQIADYFFKVSIYHGALLTPVLRYWRTEDRHLLINGASVADSVDTVSLMNDLRIKGYLLSILRLNYISNAMLVVLSLKDERFVGSISPRFGVSVPMNYLGLSCLHRSWIGVYDDGIC